jgi:hypothetical protein
MRIQDARPGKVRRLGAFAVPIGMTNVWHSFAAFLARIAAPYV